MVWPWDISCDFLTREFPFHSVEPAGLLKGIVMSQILELDRPGVAELGRQDAAEGLSDAVKTPEELARIVAMFASSDGWLDRVRLQVDQRWYQRLHHEPDYDLWVISWMPGQSTGFTIMGSPRGLLSWQRESLRSIVLGSGPAWCNRVSHARLVRSMRMMS